jgi:hypothetical protein
MKPTQNFTDYTKNNKHFQSQLTDYRQEYINDGRDSCTTFQTNISNGSRLLTRNSGCTSISFSDYELNNMNITRTSLFSPSVSSLPTEDVQFTRCYSLQDNNSMEHGSILMRAYSVQESRKSLYSS